VLTPNQEVELAVEKAAAGGRMLARHEGQVVLVSGAVPGERVLARVERTERRLAFASVVDVREPSPDRRPGFPDPRCGGCLYSHISYPRQLALKADILRDAFFRLGRIPLTNPIAVASSPERGYRTRARFHVAGSRVGFFREGTHTLCDAITTGQVSEGALEAVSLAAQILSADALIRAIELAENVDGDQRALLVSVDDVNVIRDSALAEVMSSGKLTGCALQDAQGRRLESGSPWIVDHLDRLTSGRLTSGVLRHRPEAFFQANRFLMTELVTTVLDSVAADGPVLDLYAGVGLFSIALVRIDGREVVAVEGDGVSGADLQQNASESDAAHDALTIELDSVEHYLQRRPQRSARPQTVIVDPPRTGISSQAMTSIITIGAPRIVYVSCDPATMARDARRLLDGGYALESLRAFDLFPNTPHVESLGVFVRTSA
jgi:23S rRNA (uracil1939-C5)-methyltransferase